MKPFDVSGAFAPSVPAGGRALRRVAVKGAGVTVFYSGVRLVIQMAGTVVLARLIVPRDFGLVTMLTTFSALLVGVGSSGIQEAIAQCERIDHAVASNIFWIYATLGAFLTLGFAGAGSLIAKFYGEPALASLALLLSATIFLTSVSTVHMALLLRAMRFSSVSRIEIVARAVSVAVCILFALAGWGRWALVMGACALPLSQTIGAWSQCPWMPGRPRRAFGTRTLLLFGVHSLGRFTVNYFVSNTDNLLVGLRFGARPLGFYKRAYDLFSLSASQLVSATTLVAVSALSRVRDDRAQFHRYLLGAITVVAFLGMGIAGDLTLIGEDLIRLLLGPGWESAGQIFTFFAPGIGMMLIYGTHEWIHLSLGRADRWFLWGIIHWVVTSMLFLACIHWGPQGIAVAWGLSFWILTIPAMAYAGKPIGLRVTSVLAVVWRYIAAATLAGLTTSLICPRWEILSKASGASGAALRVGVISLLFGFLYLGAIVVLHRGFGPFRNVIRLLKEMASVAPLPATAGTEAN